MSPVAAADCVSQCQAGVGACASGAANGAGAGGGAMATCLFTVNIALTVFGDVTQCSATAITTAAACPNTVSVAESVEKIKKAPEGDDS